jgi:hypothetical protein
MRELTEDEQRERDRRRASFEAFLTERMPVLSDFARRLELRDPLMIVADPERFLPSIDAYMRDQVVAPEDRAWILARLGYLIGELLVLRLSGCWFLNEVPDSRYFLRYVVGRFASASNPAATVDPFGVAEFYLSQPPGRSLPAIVRQVEDELRRG